VSKGTKPPSEEGSGSSDDDDDEAEGSGKVKGRVTFSDARGCRIRIGLVDNFWVEKQVGNNCAVHALNAFWGDPKFTAEMFEAASLSSTHPQFQVKGGGYSNSCLEQVWTDAGGCEAAGIDVGGDDSLRLRNLTTSQIKLATKCQWPVILKYGCIILEEWHYTAHKPYTSSGVGVPSFVHLDSVHLDSDKNPTSDVRVSSLDSLIEEITSKNEASLQFSSAGKETSSNGYGLWVVIDKSLSRTLQGNYVEAGADEVVTIDDADDSVEEDPGGDVEQGCFWDKTLEPLLKNLVQQFYDDDQCSAELMKTAQGSYFNEDPKCGTPLAPDSTGACLWIALLIGNMSFGAEVNAQDCAQIILETCLEIAHDIRTELGCLSRAAPPFYDAILAMTKRNNMIKGHVKIVNEGAGDFLGGGNLFGDQVIVDIVDMLEAEETSCYCLLHFREHVVVITRSKDRETWALYESLPGDKSGISGIVEDGNGNEQGQEVGVILKAKTSDAAVKMILYYAANRVLVLSDKGGEEKDMTEEFCSDLGKAFADLRYFQYAIVIANGDDGNDSSDNEEPSTQDFVKESDSSDDEDVLITDNNNKRGGGIESRGPLERKKSKK